MDNDERQLVQVKMIKDDPATPDYTKVWIYRNMVYAYPWFTSVRKILDDPKYAPWFMMFDSARRGNYTSPDCDKNCKCGHLYGQSVGCAVLLLRSAACC